MLIFYFGFTIENTIGPFPVPVIHDIIRVPESMNEEEMKRERKKAKLQTSRQTILDAAQTDIFVPNTNRTQTHCTISF
jgi:hypothetical protein